ncbi:LuxR C-terminal-related transcriptional regulator [Kitasatospora sp. SUK 42]|uniref:LuxR C-terminal-related transcriptional regulator n=1 Tax=Kitasatospora sp. SUK 42 TaxID=1588882 RepID=UPI0018C8D857|nr:LuxR C-terminal-related transcriptional regulator [Kitasatospora sp. SUK 42]MBV2155826.1 LuxR C-terminal-related transcriptional regulator [Kitasatospora sp. SUK 42]
MTILFESTVPQEEPAEHRAFTAELFGRARETAELLRLLADPAVPGVLLYGLPGSGKTRLASAVAEQYRAAGTAAGSSSPETLLTIDQIEPGEYPMLLARCASSGVKLLATGRRPPSGAGAAYRVDPLAVPVDWSPTDLDAFCRTPSVQVFTAARRTWSPGFTVTSRNQQTVGRICVELRGLPGALVLAARVAALEGVGTVLAALGGARGDGPASDPAGGGLPEGGLPAGGLPGAGAEAGRVVASPVEPPLPPADRSPGQSPDLLPGRSAGRPSGRCGPLGADEARLMSCTPLFVGGFGAEALRAVSGIAPNAFPAALEALLDRQSLTLEDRPSGRLDGTAETRLHVPFGDLPEARPADGPFASLTLRHARYYARLAAGARRRLASGDQSTALLALRVEEANLRRAVDTLTGHGLTAEALDLMEQLLAHARVVGLGPDWTDRPTAPLGAARPIGITDERARARLALIRAEARLLDGDHESATALLDEAEAASPAPDRPRSMPDEPATAARLLRLRGLTGVDRDPARALTALTAAAELLHAGDDEPEALRVELEAALASLRLGRTGPAGALAGRVLTAARHRGDVLLVGTALLHLGLLAAADGDPSSARAHYAEGLAHLRPLGAVATLGALVGLVASPLRPASARATDAARLLGSFHAERSGIPGDPTDPDLATARMLPGIRRRLAEDDFTHALAAGAATALLDLLCSLAGSSSTGTAPKQQLTSRQLEVSLLVADGLSNHQIARRLGISEWTVVNHLREAMRRLQCSSRVGVAGWVHRSGRRPGPARGTRRGPDDAPLGESVSR